jgi:non-specific serine/threonine protein kinase/serine/threonine-protein kinase
VTAERWQKVKELFEAASGLNPGKRDKFLRDSCQGDLSLLHEVESLLASSSEAGDFIETPALDSSTTLLGGFGRGGTDSRGTADFDLVAYERSSAESDIIGSMVGAYRVVDEIGEGGMGKVYRAVRADDVYQRQVAIKVVKRGMDTDFIIRRFRNERQILAGLSHPNITRLLDGGTTEGGLPYFVMEYIEGRPINEYCDQRRLSTNDRLLLFLKVCSAVQYAHQNLIVHRDLKPRNILVTPEGEPKLLDFGIAKILNLELSSQTMDPTMLRFRMMTPEYASPEQARGESITTASDVYSLGVILYELLCGHRPYRLKTALPQDIARLICEAEPLRPSTAVRAVDPQASTSTPELIAVNRSMTPEKLCRRLSGDLDNIILKAMRKEPLRRYSSAEQLADDIRRHLKGNPVTARKDTFAYRTSKFVGRHQFGIIAALLLICAVAGGALATLREHRRAERRFDQVRKMANSFLFEIHDAIEKVPDSLWARELLVKRALQYLDSLAQEAANDRSLLGELATAYRKVGDVQGSPARANMGNTSGALQSYSKALAIRQRLAELDPSDAEAKRELANGYSSLSSVLNVNGDAPAALSNSRKAVDLLESLIGASPSNAQVLNDMAVAYQYLGNAYVVTEDWQHVVECRRKTLSIYEGQLAVAPTDASMQHNVSLTLKALGAVLAKLRDKEGALRYYRQAIAMDEKAAGADPSSEQLRSELGSSYYGLGFVLAELGDFDQALVYYRKSLPIREGLLARDPRDARKQMRLANNYQEIAKLLSRRGDLDAALEEFRKVLSFRESMLTTDAASSDNRVELARAYSEMGSIAAKRKGRRPERLAECVSLKQKSLDLYEDMKDRLTGGLANEVKTVQQELEGCRVKPGK